MSRYEGLDLNNLIGRNLWLRCLIIILPLSTRTSLVLVTRQLVYRFIELEYGCLCNQTPMWHILVVKIFYIPTWDAHLNIKLFCLLQLDAITQFMCLSACSFECCLSSFMSELGRSLSVKWRIGLPCRLADFQPAVLVVGFLIETEPPRYMELAPLALGGPYWFIVEDDRFNLSLDGTNLRSSAKNIVCVGDKRNMIM